jgi:putative hemolysin
MVEALILLLLIVANGVFAMSEIAVVSTRKLRLRQLAEGGDQAAATALQPSENPNRFLATAQIGITLMGIFAGAFGSASFAAPLATLLSQVPWLTPHSEVLAVVLVVLVITYVSLVLGELVPKRIGLNNPEQIAMTVAGFMNGLSKLATPFVRLLGVSTEAVLRLLRIRHPDEPSVSDEEITGLMAQGREAGVFEETEHDIVSNIFWLSDRSAASLMLPRRDIVWLEVAATPELIREALKQYPYNRFVVAFAHWADLS